MVHISKSKCHRIRVPNMLTAFPTLVKFLQNVAWGRTRMQGYLFASDVKKCTNKNTPKTHTDLGSQIIVQLLLLGLQGVPPFTKDLADRAVVLVGVALVDNGTMALAEDHEGVHGPSDVLLVLLQRKRCQTVS